MSAFTSPLGPTVKLPLLKFTLPSKWPSMKRSSVPVTSPLMRMPWLIQAEASQETGTLVLGGRGTLPIGGEPVDISGPFSGTRGRFTYSVFHTRHLDEGFLLQ